MLTSIAKTTYTICSYDCNDTGCIIRYDKIRLFQAQRLICYV